MLVYYISLADPGITWGPNQDSKSKVEGEARIEGAKRPRIEGKARELRAKPEPRAKPEKKRGVGLGIGLGEPLLRKFLKNQTWNHFGAYLKQIIWNSQ